MQVSTGNLYGIVSERTGVRVGPVTITKAPMNGRNPGALYVKTSGEYVGKVTADGTLSVAYGITSDVLDPTLDIIDTLAERGLAYVIEQGRVTGICGFCGRYLEDPESVQYGYGPVCATKWGLPHKNRHGF